MGIFERELREGSQGPDVAELQLRLAGFQGTVPDGLYGKGTRVQVSAFQRDYMGREGTGIADAETLQATDAFARDYPLDFAALRCRCGACPGFGRGLGRGMQLDGLPGEQFHQYEYPGIHRMLLWAVRALLHYMPERGITVSSGYRCQHDNQLHGRTTTNHHGKAVDLVLVTQPGEDVSEACDAVRAFLLESAQAQIGWPRVNRKSLEPGELAPTWVHYDVRSYEPRYLEDHDFCTTLQGLDEPAAADF